MMHVKRLTAALLAVTMLGAEAVMPAGQMALSAVADGEELIYPKYGSLSYYVNDVEGAATADGTEYNEACIIGIDPGVEQVEIPAEIDGHPVATIGNHAFHGNEALKSITFPDGLKNIGDSAFYDCTALETVVIPGSVESMGLGCFMGCTSLSLLTIEEGVERIPAYTFQVCRSLRSVSIPDSVTVISESAFAGCEALSEVSFGSGLEYLAPTAFRNTPWREAQGEVLIMNGVLYDGTQVTGDYAVPEGVTRIGECAFAYNDALLSVFIPDSVTRIGEAAFDDCDGLTSAVIGSGVKSISDEAFHCCRNLIFVKLPDGLVRIGYRAFYYCPCLTTVNIPDGVTRIENEAFGGGCRSLAKLHIPESVHVIGYHAFYGTAWLEQQIEQEPLFAVNGLLLTGKTAAGDCTIPDDVKCIQNYAFMGNEELTSVVIPESVSTIGSCAFIECERLSEVTILNPICRLLDCTFTNNDRGEFTGTICGYPGSTAEAYALKHDLTFVALDGAPRYEVLADPSGDLQINASDAAIVLMAAATEGTTGVSPLTATQIRAADVNADKSVNASDAALILMYSAAVGTGYQGSIVDYIAQKN